jgi:CheY-like chemotaxis protein
LIEELVQEKMGRLEELNAKLEKALRTKSEFLANVSHEIRTPLNSIIGMAEVLAETSLNTDQKKYVDVFKKSGNSLLAIINDILDWSKLEASNVQLTTEAFALRDLFEEVMELFKRQATEKNISIRCEVAPEMVDEYFGDYSKIRQIVVNLISNSLKFTRIGGILIRLGPNETKLAGNIYCEVSDTGIGIAEDKIPILFQMFSQADSSITKEFGGTGLGLAICKRLVEIMGGEIHVFSKVGIGSRFYFTLNLEKVKATYQRESAVLKVSNLNFSRKSVLLVDDSEENRMLVKLLLKEFDFSFTEAVNGLQAVEIFAHGEFDLVLMDMQMPVMDGFAAVSRIREIETRNNRVTSIIIAITASTTEEDRQRTFQSGCNEYIPKPINKKILVNCITDQRSDRSKNIQRVSS